MKNLGERAKAPPKGQKLSGKRTEFGRTPGEVCKHHRRSTFPESGNNLSGNETGHMTAIFVLSYALFVSHYRYILGLAAIGEVSQKKYMKVLGRSCNNGKENVTL
jgi:hypothetical protein